MRMDSRVTWMFPDRFEQSFGQLSLETSA